MTIPSSQWPVSSTLPPEHIVQLRVSLRDALRQLESRLDTDVDPNYIAALVQRRSERARAEILGALARMEDGTFGSCVRCGEEIPLDRLTAVPHTPHCTSCARIVVDR